MVTTVDLNHFLIILYLFVHYFNSYFHILSKSLPDIIFLQT